MSDSSVLLEYLHRAGVVFYNAGLFEGKIILDQSWALNAIYTVLDRRQCVKWLKGTGTFTQSDLHQWVWRDAGFNEPEEQVFLSMMESCGICFRLGNNELNETVYLAPELLPDRAGVKTHLAGRLRSSDLPRKRRVFHYRFFHERIVRQMLSTIGRKAQDSAVYWRDGCWLYETQTDAYAVIEARSRANSNEPNSGVIELTVFGDNYEGLFHMLTRLITGFEPKPARVEEAGEPAHFPRPLVYGAPDEDSLSAAVFGTPAPAPRGARPAVYISYAWGDHSTAGQQRTEAVESLYRRLKAEGFDVRRDCRQVQNGDSIQAFMKNFGKADHVIAIISDKYLRSTACMFELYSVWQNCNEDPDEFRTRVHPLILDDAQIGSTAARLTRVAYWKTEKETLAKAQQDLGADFGVEDQRELRCIAAFTRDISDMLRWLNDVLMPRGFAAIQSNNYDAVIEVIRRVEEAENGGNTRRNRKTAM